MIKDLVNDFLIKWKKWELFIKNFNIISIKYIFIIGLIIKAKILNYKSKLSIEFFTNI